jgi:hypothetical protein
MLSQKSFEISGFGNQSYERTATVQNPIKDNAKAAQREAYFALAMERRLWRGLRSFPRRPF